MGILVNIDKSGALTDNTLLKENSEYHGTGGVSQGNRAQGFVPAFHDAASGQSYVSRFADGRQAPLHLLDGLPESLVIERSAAGIVKAVKKTVTAGFLLMGQFYTREQAAVALSEQPTAALA